MEKFDRGDVLTRTYTSTVGGVATDPTNLTLYVTPPDGILETYTWVSGGVNTITRTGAGAFERDIPATQIGTWKLRWVATGTAAGAEVDAFIVRSDGFPA
jgi:hypothetical protein